MNKNKEYANSLRSRKAIQNALFELLLEKGEIEKVSVSELAKKAGVSRGTFYNHYQSTVDVIDEGRKELTRNYMSFLDQIGEEDWISSFFFGINGFILEHRDSLKLLLCSFARSSFVKARHFEFKLTEDSFIKHYPVLKEDSKKRLGFHMFLHGIAWTYIDYICGLYDVDLGTVAEIAIDQCNALL